jgi:hypothetical protein
VRKRDVPTRTNKGYAADLRVRCIPASCLAEWKFQRGLFPLPVTAVACATDLLSPCPKDDNFTYGYGYPRVLYLHRKGMGIFSYP